MSEKIEEKWTNHLVDESKKIDELITKFGEDLMSNLNASKGNTYHIQYTFSKIGEIRLAAKQTIAAYAHFNVEEEKGENNG